MTKVIHTFEDYNISVNKPIVNNIPVIFVYPDHDNGKHSGYTHIFFHQPVWKNIITDSQMKDNTENFWKVYKEAEKHNTVLEESELETPIGGLNVINNEISDTDKVVIYNYLTQYFPNYKEFLFIIIDEETKPSPLDYLKDYLNNKLTDKEYFIFDISTYKA